MPYKSLSPSCLSRFCEESIHTCERRLAIPCGRRIRLQASRVRAPSVPAGKQTDPTSALAAKRNGNANESQNERRTYDSSGILPVTVSPIEACGDIVCVISSARMRVRFWGVRGSVPWATPGSIGHGCNTPCVEIVDEPSGRRLILDAGSGIVGVGATLDAVTNIPDRADALSLGSRAGAAVFCAAVPAGCAVTVWAPALGRQFADIETMFESPFFPVPYDRLPSRPAIRMNGGGRRGNQRLRRVGAAAESSGRIVRVSNRRRQRRSRVRDRSRVRQRRHRSRRSRIFRAALAR